jgi:hypothetical protein
MKKLFVFALIALGMVSCKKEANVSNLSEQQRDVLMQQFRAGNFGLVPDDPERVAKVPFFMSNEFIQSSRAEQTRLSDFVSQEIEKNTAHGHGKPQPQPQPTPDTTAPTVVISSPAQGANVSGAVTVTVSAIDNVGVSSLSFAVNSVLQQTVSATSYNFLWDATSYAGTSPQLTATARDAAGNSKSYSITVIVGTPPPPPPPPPAPSDLPSAYRMATPPVGNQGAEGSCVSWDEAYGAMSVETYYRTGATSFSYSSNIFSPEYNYDYAKLFDCSGGTSMTTALDVMVNKGSCTWSTLPYSDQNGCDVSIASPYDAQASANKIPRYSKLQTTDITGIKTMVASNHPVMISIAVDQAFMSAGAGFIWNTNGTGGGAGHSVFICGYDDSKHAYLIQNSWGTGWGDQGYCYIDYDFLVTKSGYYVYVMNY